MKKLVLFLALLAACLTVAGSASASNPILTYSPNPIVAGDSIVFSGCGYTSGHVLQVQLVRNTKTAEWIFQVDEVADSVGCISTANAPYVLASSGKWTANVYDFNTGKHLVTVNVFVG